MILKTWLICLGVTAAVILLAPIPERFREILLMPGFAVYYALGGTIFRSPLGGSFDAVLLFGTSILAWSVLLLALVLVITRW